jgi:hypothetical protein
MPALRFNRLTPLFDYVAAVVVRDRAIKRRVVGCARMAARAAPGVTVTGLDADASILARALRPGGRLVVGDVGRPQDPFMRVLEGSLSVGAAARKG